MHVSHQQCVLRQRQWNKVHLFLLVSAGTTRDPHLHYNRNVAEALPLHFGLNIIRLSIYSRLVQIPVRNRMGSPFARTSSCSRRNIFALIGQIPRSL